jgi:hypothetical protein
LRFLKQTKETESASNFPDVPGCVSCGDNFDHALQMAKEAADTEGLTYSRLPKHTIKEL